MSSYSASGGVPSGNLVTRKVDGFAGVDFSNNDTNLARSPDSLNMWKNYKNNSAGIETRPDMQLVEEYDDVIYGLFFYDYNNETHKIVHCGNKLYDNHKVIFSNMNLSRSQSFIFDSIFYIKDGLNYLEYDGEEIKEVVGTIPITTTGKSPSGSGTTYQDVNLLTSIRKNSFVSDGKSLEYKLDTEAFDSDYPVKIWIDDELIDNSKKSQITDKNGYLKYVENDDVYWYDKSNQELYNSVYEKIVNGELHKIYNDNEYIKYQDNSSNVYWYYDNIVYDSGFLSTNKSVSDLTKVTTTITLSQLSSVLDYPYSSYPNEGKIVFSSPPSKPLTDGQDNVIIEFSKTIKGYRDKINKCTLLTVFDNRVFFGGNKDYPNTIYHSSLEDPRYVSDLDYYNEGVDLSPVKSMVAGNNALWVFKEPSQENTTVFYHNPTIDSEYGKVYPSVHSSISLGCVAEGINFNDDIVFFSDRGMEAISGDITTEQVLAHRSSMVDGKLLKEINYKDMILEEWEGYLLVFIDNKVYLADSRQKYQNVNIEYEWYYWELDKNITCTSVKNGVLYLCGNNSIYSLTKIDGEIKSYWTTKHDDFKYPQYQKTTNKRGGTAEIFGSSVNIEVKTDNNDFELINTYQNAKGYIVYRIKKKKWKKLQMRFNSNTPFGLNSYTLESFIGGYVKR